MTGVELEWTSCSIEIEMECERCFSAFPLVTLVQRLMVILSERLGLGLVPRPRSQLVFVPRLKVSTGNEKS